LKIIEINLTFFFTDFSRSLAINSEAMDLFRLEFDAFSFILLLLLVSFLLLLRLAVLLGGFAAELGLKLSKLLFLLLYSIILGVLKFELELLL